MSDSPKDSDFNWVKARHECSIEFEFECLRRDIEASQDVRMRQLGEEREAEIIVKSKPDLISVQLRNGRGGIAPCVVFHLERGKIVVRPLGSAAPFELTLTLNNEGECRFRIDGEGEHRRWQVLRRALEELLFDESGPATRP